MRDLDSPLVDDFVRWVRTRSGNRVVPKRKSMRELLRTLRGGGIVGILLDQNVTWSEGVFVDFFGKLACTNKGAALLAVASGSPVIPTFIVREGGRHRIIIGREIEVVNSGERRSDVVENTFRFTRAIEDMVRRYPDQWFWIHQRWKSRPENDPRRETDLAAPCAGPRPGEEEPVIHNLTWSVIRKNIKSGYNHLLVGRLISRIEKPVNSKAQDFYHEEHEGREGEAKRFVSPMIL